MIFFFTGTGNSLHVARCIEPDPISIPQAIHGDLVFSSETIGVVAPIYGHEVPRMVKEFLKSSVFHTDYFYMVLTYGTRHGGASELAEKLCRDCGIEPAYINVLQMVDNWLPAFDMSVEIGLDKYTEENLRSIVKDVKTKRLWISPVTDDDCRSHQMFLDYMSTRPIEEWQHLIVVGDGCIGCDICTKVCPSGSMTLDDNRAVFASDGCQTCLACVHACPERAIHLAIPERNPNSRFRNANVSLKDIIDANDQTRFRRGQSHGAL